MHIKALLLDFEGTLVKRDMLVRLAERVGKEAESEQLSKDFQAGINVGLEALIERINLLSGMRLRDIEDEVNSDLDLVDGAEELVSYCKSNDIVTIIASGTIKPVLDLYKEALGAEYIVCSEPDVSDGELEGISLDNYPKGMRHFKVVGIEKILIERGISAAECVAIGDGRADIPMFEMASFSIAINPQGGIEKYADEVVTDLHQALNIIVRSISE